MRGTRPLKRWRYVGHYSSDLMLCAADARIGPMPQRWWAVALPDGSLRGKHDDRPRRSRRVGLACAGRRRRRADRPHLEESGGVEIASPAGADGNYMWTRKQALVPVRGHVVLGGRRHEIDDVAFIDDSAGYHPRHTAWMWSAGNGTAADGRAVAWNLVNRRSRLTARQRAHPVGRRRAAGAGPGRRSRPTCLPSRSRRAARSTFTEWSAREEHMNLLLMRSDYRQPFGTFAGTLPGGIEMAEGYGVMETHDVLW